MSRIVKVSPYIASKINRKRKDFRVDTFRAGGNGGQNQNKVESGVRITDSITKISVDCRETPDQSTNKQRAFFRLVQKLIDHYKKEEQTTQVPNTPEVIRSYKLTKGVVIDHRTKEVYDADRVLNGHLGTIHDRLLIQNAGEKSNK